MVVKEDGTKWACQSCLKGHRVSGCTHTDRELFFVPKKGRPVTQCQHCRAERKKRSSHIKCDCGDKVHTKEKCVHLREAEAKAAAVAAAAGTSGVPGVPNAMCNGERHSPELMPVAEESPTSDDHHCCCPHGGQCICSSMKKEPPIEDAKEAKEPKEPKEPKASPNKDVAKESIMPASRSLSQRKPKLASHQSEGHLTVFANGHHKPVHRNNNAAHESGAPYKLPRSHTTQPIPTTSRRSVDSLASVASTQPHAWFTNINTNTLPSQTTTSGTASPASATTAQHDYMQQDNKSPGDVSSQFPVSTVSSSVPTSMFNDFGFPSTSSIATSATDSSMPAFSMPGSDYGMNNQEFWSNFNWSKIGSTSFDAQPALTHTSSGTMSEVDEIPAADDMTTLDNSYSMNMQDLVTGNNNNSNNNNNSVFDLDFGVSTSQSENWNMPTYNQTTPGVDLAAMTADSFSKPKQIADHSMVLNQFSGFDMSSSAQSQSPVHSNFNWDQSIFDYGMSNNNSTNSLAYSMAGSTGPSVAPTAAPSPKFNADNANYTQDFDFDNSAKLVWNDSMVIPAGQDFLNTYNYDQNFSTTDFDNNNGWTS